MNQKLSQAGRKGGMSGRGKSKVRPLTQERARQMAAQRWAKSNPTYDKPPFYPAMNQVTKDGYWT